MPRHRQPLRARVNMRRPGGRHLQAFTLIELLVVIAIIAILISILMPSLAGARERSRSVVCRTQMREIGTGAVMYAQDYGMYPPCVDNYTASGINTDRVGLDWLGIGDQFGAFAQGTPGDPSSGNPKGFVDAPKYGLLYKYCNGNPRIIMCPSDFYEDYRPNQIAPGGNGKFTYTMVAMMGLRLPERIPAALHMKGTMRPASTSPLLVEEHPDGTNNAHREGNFGAGISPQPGMDAGDTLVSRHGPFFARRGVKPSSGGPSPFPQGDTNIAFADGHVEPIKTNFGMGGTYEQSANWDGIANNIVGLMYHYGVKFELLRFAD